MNPRAQELLGRAAAAARERGSKVMEPLDLAIAMVDADESEGRALGFQALERGADVRSADYADVRRFQKRGAHQRRLSALFDHQNSDRLHGESR